MSRPPRLSFVLLLLACTPAAWATENEASLRAALDSIQAGQIRESIEELADARLEGREAGSRGGHAAGERLRARLAALGLRGIGPGGSFFQPFGTDYRNILALLEGSDPVRKHQWIIVGAHYDHIGFATSRGSTLGPSGVLHPGADDNASGTAGLLELAEAFRLLPEPPRRSVVFAFWDAEEKGLLGSKHFAQSLPPSPTQIVLGVNLDMIGRLRNDRLLIFGTRSAYGLRRLVSAHNVDHPLTLQFSWALNPDADHYPLFAAGVPVLMFHTDVHEDYHRPSDTADRVDATGSRRAVQLLFRILYDVAQSDEPLRFRAEAKTENEAARKSFEQPAEPPQRLGVSWDPQPDPGHGLRITRVTSGSAAETAGLQPGDRIVEFAGKAIRTDADLRAAVRAAPTRTAAVLEHPPLGPRSSATIELHGAPLRFGVTWRVDDAEPAALVLTYVAPGSPAARAGLEVGDRIYRIQGRDVFSDLDLGAHLRRLPDPVRMEIEHNGRVRSVEVIVRDEAPRRAA